MYTATELHDFVFNLRLPQTNLVFNNAADFYSAYSMLDYYPY